MKDHEDDVISNHNYNEPREVFQEIYIDFEKLGLNNTSLKKKISYLQNELNMRKEIFENIEKAKISFEKENEELKILKWSKDF